MCVCVCVWRPPVGAGAETEAERHSQAKDNKVCVLGGRGGGGGDGGHSDWHEMVPRGFDLHFSDNE